MDQLVALRAPERSAPLARLADLITAVPVVDVDAMAPDVDELFRSDAMLTSVLVASETGTLLLSRTRFEFHMAGRLGFGRAVYRRRSIRTMLPESTLHLDGETDLAAAASAVLARPEDCRYDDVVVHDAHDAGVVTVSALLESLARQFAYRALHDPLTGLPNRLLLAQHCRAAAEAWDVADPHRPVLLYIDLDRFKAVNDQHGHPAGDAVLVEYARRLETIAGSSGVAARLGGDEFAVLLTGLSEPQAAGVADQVVLAAESPFLVGEGVIHVGASVGLAVPSPGGEAGAEHGRTDSVEVLLRHADAAMYRAKQHGRGGVVVAGPGDDTLVPRATLIAERLKVALDVDGPGGLALHFQPKYDLLGGDLLEVEALLRWHDDELGTVGPAEFVPIAEEEGLIGTLSRWVFDAAFAAAASWPREMVPRLAVNISPLHLVEPGFCNQVADALERSGLPAERVCMEITETAAVADVDLAVTRLVSLRAMGVRLALDDFGTGASSLTLLRRLPVDVIKIDREFIDCVDVSGVDATLVGLVIDAAHGLGRSVCAEGVERPGQVTKLRSLGCDSAQGYLLGMPVPASELAHGRCAALGGH